METTAAEVATASGSGLGLLRRLALRGSGQGALAARVLGDELLGLLASLVVGPLAVRGLHQVAGRAVELTGDAVVESQLQDPHGVDDDPCRVRRVPDLE